MVNYDFTFLAMLIANAESPGCEKRSCPVNRLRKRSCLRSCAELGTAADYTVILAWWKLRDGASDEGFFKATGYRLASAFLYHAFRKASRKQSAFAAAAEHNLDELNKLEKSRCQSIDRVADKFALILQSAAGGVSDTERRRILDELLYHIGRIIYFLDAIDDFEEDIKKGNYNPLVTRFSVQNGVLSEDDRNCLRLSIQHSLNCISSAFVLMPKNQWTEILSNILYLGLPWVAESVFSGRWTEQKKISIHH